MTIDDITEMKDVYKFDLFGRTVHTEKASNTKE